ncbi:MAG: heme lyase CcmF/NrfE family subunit [Proteobacteria bacterium]|nr:heme lyase CcmF/NrfE family subunit [Pseudomonadota bacterium]
MLGSVPEIGHYALTLALGMAILAASLPMIGAARGDRRLIALSGPLTFGQLFFIGIAFASLTYSFVVSDFSVLTVAMNSHSAKPMLYKISGVWGNHEGSLLLWAFILALFASAVALFGSGLPAAFRARVLSVQAAIGVGFLLFMLLTSNPFDRLDPPPLDGNGLNPLLQDPGLAFHPPILYLGYVGFSIAFSFAIAALIEGKVTPAWARWVRPWTLTAWSFLTAGIALGSWWAYYELGWGGWWFWDPVENASFMPWLAGTALLHSVLVVEKRGAMKSWTILLAIMAFSLSLLGTFLVRSGVLTSVHAFAVDPARGVFILGFLALVIGGSLTLFAMRAHKLQPGGFFQPISREGALVFNNLILVTAVATVFFGTLYPLFLDALTGEKISVGAPYFKATFVPLMMPLILAMAIGPMMAWKRADLAGVLGRLKLAAGLTFIVVIIAAWQVTGGMTMALVGVALGTWLAAGVIGDLAGRIKLFRVPLGTSLRRAVGLPRNQWGVTLAHLGMAVAILGMTGAESWTTERLVVVREGEVVELAGYEFRFDGAEPVAGPNYTALRGHFSVFRDGELVTRLAPEDRTYANPRMQTTEAAIHSLFLGDLYAVIGDPDGSGGWSARLYIKPLVSWMWAGAGLMVFGGMLSISARRVRRKHSVRAGQPSPSAQAAE